MDNELFELMTKTYGEMQEMKIDIKGIKEDTKDLKEGQERIDNKLDDLEVNNAGRHLVINGEIRRIKATLSKVELVTADNWSDIARMKAKRRVK